MEPIKDLDLLIAETERASVVFDVLRKLPRVLEVIRAAQNMPAELDRDIKGKKGELAGLEDDVFALAEDREKLKEEILQAGSDLASLEKKSAEKQAILVKMMDSEVEENRNAANDKIRKSLEAANDKVMGHEESVRESEEKMIESVKFSREQIDIHKKQEMKAKGLADEARATLEKITKSLSGEGE